MAIKRYRLRLSLFAIVTLLALVNALALWGKPTAFRVDTALQICAATTAIVCGVIGARRANGAPRWWRLLAVGSVAFWLIAQLSSWSVGAVKHDGVAPPEGVVAYFLWPILGVAAVLLLARAAHAVALHTT